MTSLWFSYIFNCIQGKKAAAAGAVGAALTFMHSSRENGKVKTIRIHEKASRI